MKKYCVSNMSIINLMTLIFFVLTTVSCSEEGEIFTSDPGNGMKSLEFKIRLSDFNGSSDASPTEKENAINDLSLFLFRSNGEEWIQENRRHVIENEKITVTIPETVIGEGLKAYLVANMHFSDDPVTEEELLQSKSTRRPEDFISDGFPMCTDALPIVSGDAVTVDALLQRVP